MEKKKGKREKREEEQEEEEEEKEKEKEKDKKRIEGVLSHGAIWKLYHHSTLLSTYLYCIQLSNSIFPPPPNRLFEN